MPYNLSLFCTVLLHSYTILSKTLTEVYANSVCPWLIPEKDGSNTEVDVYSDSQAVIGDITVDATENHLTELSGTNEPARFTSHVGTWTCWHEIVDELDRKGAEKVSTGLDPIIRLYNVM